MTASTQPSFTRKKRNRVAHIRFSEDEIQALEVAAKQAGLSVSAFVRSLSLEGAGVRPFMSREDKAIVALLIQDMRNVASNLNRIARFSRAGSLAAPDMAGAIDEARAIAVTVAAELAAMTTRAGAVRRGGAS
jgi:hypothetical protein